MSQYIDAAVRAFPVSAAVKKNARVKLASGQVAEAGLTDKDIGTALAQAFAAGDVIPIRMMSSGGTEKVIAAAAITQGAEVYTAAAGKVSVSASTAFRVGIALEAATADLDIIEIVRGTHGDTAVP